MTVTDEMVQKALESLFPFNAAYNEGAHERLKARIRNAFEAALATLPEDAGRAAEVECVPDDSYEAAQVERRELWKQRVDELVGELSKNLRHAFAEASAAPATGQEG